MAKAVTAKRKIVGVKKGAGSMATKAKRKKVAPKAADKIMAKAALRETACESERVRGERVGTL